MRFKRMFFKLSLFLFLGWLLTFPLQFSPKTKIRGFYTVPPKPGSPAQKIRPIPHPPGPPPWVRGKSTSENLAPSYQTTGNINAVNLNVDFKDKIAKTPLYYYDDLLFDPTGYPNNILKSLRAYYKEISYTGIDVTGEVYGKAKSSPTSWVNWVRASRVYTYYSNNNGFGRYPTNAQRLTEDTVKAVDPYVNFANFSLYQGTEAGVSGYFVSALYIVHAGPGAEVTGNSKDIWSHSWATRTPIKIGDKTADGKPIYVYRYIMMAEDSPMGIFSHEFGHTLNLPDLYDYDGSSAGVGSWSLMSYGSWNDDGYTPAHLDAWCKVNLGWVNPTVVTTETNTTVPQVENNSVVYKLKTGQANEYFLIENRQRQLFDTALPGDGLLIYHIDDSIADNNNELHYHVAVEQADGKLDLEHWVNAGDAGDPYPGMTLNRVLNDTSIPNSKNYAGLSTSVSVSQISDSGTQMTATMSGGY